MSGDIYKSNIWDATLYRQCCSIRLAEYLTQLFGVKTGNPNLASVWIAKTGEKNALKYPGGIRWGSLFRFFVNQENFRFDF